MKSNRKKIVTWSLTALLVLLLGGSLIGYKLYTKPHRSVTAENALSISAVALVSAYESSETDANAKYLDKVLEVTGKVTDLVKNQKGETVITLKGTDMSGLLCTLETSAKQDVQPGNFITVRGICTGYLMDVVLVRAIVVPVK